MANLPGLQHQDGQQDLSGYKIPGNATDSQAPLSDASGYTLPEIAAPSPMGDPYGSTTSSTDYMQSRLHEHGQASNSLSKNDHRDDGFVPSQERSTFSPIAAMPGATADSPVKNTSGGAHVAGEGYSASNPVPTVSGYKEDRRKQEEDQQRYEEEEQKREAERKRREAEQSSDANKESKTGTHKADQPAGSGKSGQDEKEEMKKRMAPPKGQKANQIEHKGPREVIDPVTGTSVIVEDAEFHPDYDQDSLDPSNSAPGPAEHRPVEEGKLASTKHVSPVSAKPGNINLQTFPPPIETDSLKQIKVAMDQITIAGAVGLVVVWWFVAFGSGYIRFFWRTGLLIGLGVLLWMAGGIAAKNVEHELERVRMSLHKQRADKFSPPTPESVEWINSFLSVAWKMISPDMFVSTIDMVEDVMQASLPGIVNAIKISDYGQGSNPVRIVSMRALPDKPTDKDYPKEEWIDQGVKPSSEEQEAKRNEQLSKSSEEQDLDESGEYVNYEVSLAYNALSGQSLRQSNIHLLLEFFLGAYDLFSLPVPIWAQVEGFAATARLRIQMIPEFPYIRNLTFTLMGIPKVEVSVQPMAKGFPNVLDLPIISGFVQSSIAAAAAAYVAPKSMTLNMAQILSGGGIKKDTKALGVLAITLHHATGLSAQDKNGKSDPYIVLAYAKFGKPLYSSRIITGDLNPVWEETAFLLLSDDEVKAGEDLAVMLWDSDKRTADDLIGRVQVPVADLMLKPNQVFERTDDLMGFQDADDMKGKISWSCAFYDKAAFNPKLKRNVNNDLPAEIRNRPELQENNQTGADTQAEAQSLTIPPDPSYPAGVLSVIVHQINNLERQNLKGASGKDREGKAGQDTSDASEQTDNLPSAYCELVVNDDLVYKTRVKQYTSMPFYEAGTETFIRDWRSTVVRVVTRDSRVREHDPIMGIVTLPLAKILSNSSQVTRLYAMQDGVGFGRVNISLLFRSVEAKVPRNYLGWETGTLEILSDIRFEPASGSVDSVGAKKLKISVSSSDAQYKIKAKSAHTEGQNVSWSLDETVRLPLYDRYSSSLVFELDPGTKIMGLGSEADAVATLWFQDLVDDEETEVRIPLVSADNISILRQNVINKAFAETHKYETLGYLVCKVKLDSGLDPDHLSYADTQTKRHEAETYLSAEGMAEISEKNAHAMDDGVIDKREKQQITQAHKQELRSRHRGIYQSGTARTAVWGKDGIKSRFSRIKDKITGKETHEKSVESEA